MRAGVPRVGRPVGGPVAVAPAGRDRQAADGRVSGRRGEAAAGDAADGLDRGGQAAAGVDGGQADAAARPVAAGLLVERRDGAAQRRGAAHAHRARPQLRDRHERRVAARRPVAAVRLAVRVQRQRQQPRPVPQPPVAQAGRRGRRRRVAALRRPVRAQPGRAGPVAELPHHGRRHRAADHARGQRRVHAPGARPVRLRGHIGRVAGPPAQVHGPAAAGHEADAPRDHRGHQQVPTGQRRPVHRHRDAAADQVRDGRCRRRRGRCRRGGFPDPTRFDRL